jgi:hypothetical protein
MSELSSPNQHRPLKHGVRRSTASIYAILFVLVLPKAAHSCTLVSAYNPVPVGKEFRVRVTDRGSPVRGLRVMLASDAPKIVMYAPTDADGYAFFSNLSLGVFAVTSDHDAGPSPDSVQVEVSRNGPANVVVQLRWPNLDPIRVRSASGMLRGPDYYPSQLQVPLSLSLLEAISTRVLATTMTDSKGRFDFREDNLPPGLYFLQLNPSGLRSMNEEIQGWMPVSLDPQAKQDVLNVDMGWSSCGLDYAEQEQQTEIRTSKICGDVADSAGVGIFDVQILLLGTGEDAQVVDQTTAKNGRFTLQEQHKGSYQLLVKSVGFQPFLAPIRLQGANQSKSCQQPIHIRLRLGL